MREVLTPPREVSTSHPSILSTFKPLLTLEANRALSEEELAGTEVIRERLIA
jgi:hypothetical protein